MVVAWVRLAVMMTALFVFAQSDVWARTVFLGGSQTAGWNYMGCFKDVENKAVVSNTTAKILKNIGPVIDLKPEKIFILEGVNELWSANDSILARYREILRRINQGSPETVIFVQSVLPVVHRPDLSNEKIVELNAGLKTLCGEMQRCVYVDLFSHFAVNGALNEQLTTDGVHLRPDGYKLWQSLIEAYVEQPNNQILKPDTVARLGQEPPAQAAN